MKNKILYIMALTTIGCLNLPILAQQENNVNESKTTKKQTLSNLKTNVKENLAIKRKQAAEKLSHVGQQLKTDLKELFKDLVKNLDPRKPKNVNKLLNLVSIIIKDVQTLIEQLQPGQINLEATGKEAFAKMQCLIDKKRAGCDDLNCSSEKECIVSTWKTIKPALSLLLTNLLGSLDDKGQIDRHGIVALTTGLLPDKPTSKIGQSFQKVILGLTQAILTAYNLMESLVLTLDFNPETTPAIPLEPITIQEEELENIEGLEGFEEEF